MTFADFLEKHINGVDQFVTVLLMLLFLWIISDGVGKHRG